MNTVCREAILTQTGRVKTAVKLATRAPMMGGDKRGMSSASSGG